MFRNLALITAIAASVAVAQDAPPLEVDVVGGIDAPMPIAVPAMATPQAVATAAGNTGLLGNQVAAVVASDLRSSGLFTPIGPDGLDSYS